MLAVLFKVRFTNLVFHGFPAFVCCCNGQPPKDNSGHINASELAELCYDLGYHLDKVEVAAALRALDTDKNGYGPFIQLILAQKHKNLLLIYL